MKKVLTALVMSVASMTALAQQAEIIVSYDYSFPSLRRGMKKEKMTLLASAKESKYFNDMSLWVDSLKSTPEGKEKYREIFNKACVVTTAEGMSIDLRKGPNKSIYTYVFTTPEQESLTLYDKLGGELVYYTEPLSELSWEIHPDSTATILGYECVKAEADYHGRHWTAWFSPEVPMPYGPWKLHGLPGLIFKAGAEGGFLFEATGIEATDRLITPMYKQDDYSKVDRLKALDDHEYYNNNTESMLNARFGGKVKIQKTYDENGKEVEDPKYDGRTLSLEPDYKKDK